MNGKDFEKTISINIHQEKYAFLISPLLLRRHNLGQIDIATINKQQVILYEVKSSSTGARAMYKGEQISRLRSAAKVLSCILEKEVQLKIIAKR